jgi:hypothetical protein
MDCDEPRWPGIPSWSSIDLRAKQNAAPPSRGPRSASHEAPAFSGSRMTIWIGSDRGPMPDQTQAAVRRHGELVALVDPPSAVLRFAGNASLRLVERKCVLPRRSLTVFSQALSDTKVSYVGQRGHTLGLSMVLQDKCDWKVSKSPRIRVARNGGLTELAAPAGRISNRPGLKKRSCLTKCKCRRHAP